MQKDLENKKKLLNHKKSQVVKLVICLLLILSITVTGTVAFLVTHTTSITNRFDDSYVACEVSEDFNEVTKRDVKIKNTGDTQAYIRAYVNVVWMNDAHEVYGVSPTESEYTIDYVTDGDWLEGSDGYWYYKYPVNAGDLTTTLINECSIADGVTAPDGYYLSVEIVCQAVQSTPYRVVGDMWHVTLNGTVIVAVGTNS